MGFVCLVIGHSGKPRADDGGAQFDIDKDGTVERDEQEAQFTPGISWHAYRTLRARGHKVALLGHGTYEERVAWAIREGADVIAHVHVNAGAGKHGLVIHLDGSTSGQWLAKAIAEALEKVGKPALSDVKLGTPNGGYPRAAKLLDLTAKAKPVSIVYEPAFLDQPAHHDLLTNNQELLGVALALGIAAYLG